MVDDHRAHHLDRKLGRQQRHRSRPHILTGRLFPGEIQSTTDEDRAGRDPRQEPDSDVRPANRERRASRIVVVARVPLPP
jgi:hypothetical protein